VTGVQTCALPIYIQEPDGLFFNYSCYSSSYQLIDSAGYWDIDMIPEDWHIFLETFFVSGGKTSVNPIFLPTVVDAPDGHNAFSALKNRYNQCIRHAWGATDIPYAIEQARIHKEIPFLTNGSPPVIFILLIPSLTKHLQSLTISS